MFCPVCKCEYEPGITQCPDDKAQLVDQLKPETLPDNSDSEFVLLHHFGLAPEAEMVNEMLRQNNIRSVVRSGSTDALSPLLSSATSFGAAVLVDERDYERAQELYTAIFGDDVTPLMGGTSEGDEESEEYQESDEDETV